MLQPPQVQAVSANYANEILELREFFSTAGITVGTAQSLAAVTTRIHDDRSFRRDLTSHVWVVLHSAVPPAGYAEVLAILAVAAAGTHFAAAADEADAHSLLRFLMQARASFGAPSQAPATAQAPFDLPPMPLRSGSVALLPDLSTPVPSRVAPDATSLFLHSTAELVPGATPWQRRPIVWGAAAACLLLLMLVGFWPHARPGVPPAAPILSPSALPASSPTATLAPPAPLPTAPLVKPSAGTHRASLPAHRSRTAAPRNEPPAARVTVVAPASAASVSAAAPARSRAARRLAAASPAAPAKPRSGVPAVAAIDLGNSTAPRTNGNGKTGGSRDGVIATLSTPIVRPTSIGIMASHVMYYPSPVYPEQASVERIQGEVKLEAEVDRNGNVVSTRVISGPPQLRAATEEAVQHWHYRPYLYDGKPIAMNAEVVVDYQLP